jgi:hypothetical protein
MLAHFFKHAMVLLAAIRAVGFAESLRRAGAVADEVSPIGESDRLRLMIETDAGGDPDDEQSLVRFLLYANEWDVEGIIARRWARVRNKARPASELSSLFSKSCVSSLGWSFVGTAAPAARLGEPLVPCRLAWACE